ncbi:MAG: DUF3368 domain-containing protein [Acidobacteriaceae bacterium]
MIVVSDTSPLNYLVLIGHIDLLPRLYERIVIPRAVLSELSADKAPKPIKRWIQHLPNWIVISEAVNQDPSLFYLDRGEQDGIALAQSIHADIILLDEFEAREAAKARNVPITGTLGVLLTAAENGWINFPKALEDLRATNFRAASSLIDRLLEQNKK